MKPVELIPLRCLRCSTPVPAAPDQVAWACMQCGQGLLLDEVKGLAYLEINYSPLKKAIGRAGPICVRYRHVFIERDAIRGGSNRIASEVEEDWGQGRQFFIPAYSAPLEDLLSRAVEMLQRPPGSLSGPAAAFVPVTLSPGDLTAAAEFIVLAVEAARKDKLRQAQVKVVLESPSLWIFP